MTCEVAVLNKYAVVMAADSAVTYGNGRGETRYSKGGNKIFQLSHHEPVGIMIYDSGSLLAVPWELIIKQYRDELGKSHFNTINEYADNFVEYLAKTKKFFSLADKEEAYLEVLGEILVSVLTEVIEEFPILKDSNESVADRTTAWKQFVNIRQADLGTKSLLVPLDQQGISDLEDVSLKKHVKSAQDILQSIENAGLGAVKDAIDIDEWIKLSVLISIKRYGNYSSKTGIVISGYGREQHFAELVSCEIVGYVGGQLVATKEKPVAITRQSPSQIKQFATTSMVDVFTQGYGYDIFKAVNTTFRKESINLVDEIVKKLGISTPIPDLGQILQNAAQRFSDGWTDKLWEENFVNLKINIGTLPIDEMVHLAETLIVLESLKEKVTSPSQSVGGPVDVAVITKSEGLIWVKRKEFFDSAKNPRYILRQQQNYR